MKEYRCLIGTPWTNKGDVYRTEGEIKVAGLCIYPSMYPELFEEIVEPKIVGYDYALIYFVGSHRWSLSTGLYSSLGDACSEYDDRTPMPKILWPASDYWDDKTKRYILPK